MKLSYKILLILLVLFGAGMTLYLLAVPYRVPQGTSDGNGAVQVVAGENFWGSLASQIGGSRARVFSIVSDPNADPHEYETNAGNARAIAAADYVIENGAGYDSWVGKLLGAEPNPGRKVLNIANLIGKKEGDNPHFWYSPDYVNRAAAQMKQDLSAIDPQGAGIYAANYANLQLSLAQYENRIAEIKNQFAGTKVAATEDIFTYLADAARLDLVSPPAFTQAIAEGNDPAAASIVQFEDQLQRGGIRVLVYNEQTITPLTDRMKTTATYYHIPIVGITEIIQPSDVPFETWMDSQVASLQQALQKGTPQ